MWVDDGAWARGPAVRARVPDPHQGLFFWVAGVAPGVPDPYQGFVFEGGEFLLEFLILTGRRS